MAVSHVKQASSLLQQCTASDVWMDAQGSDHAPAWADFDFLDPLPIADPAPALSTKHLFTGDMQRLVRLVTCTTDYMQSQVYTD